MTKFDENSVRSLKKFDILSESMMSFLVNNLVYPFTSAYAFYKENLYRFSSFSFKLGCAYFNSPSENPLFFQTRNAIL